MGPDGFVNLPYRRKFLIVELALATDAIIDLRNTVYDTE
jgi:hypothetical protein